VTHLQETGVLRDPAVTEAFQAVLRHRFLPGKRLAYVYEDTAIPTKTDGKGVPLSSSSQPAIMALMLQQLRLEAGQRVLEIGTGTGYNAALLDRLVTPGGQVHTLDIDDEVCAQARANLKAAGVEGVRVLHADGGAGCPEAAPFDRVVVTASVADLATAWLDQLIEAGRLVVPLALAGPCQLCVAFVKHGRTLISDGLSCCGFLALRGEMGLGPQLTEPPASADGLMLPGRPTWVSLPADDVSAGFKAWLALSRPGYVEHRLHPEAPLVFGLRDERGAALAVPEQDALWIYAFGEGAQAAQQLRAAHREWASRRPQLEQLEVAAYPTGQEPAAGHRQLRFSRSRFTFLVTHP
jgi:protein-L-isoaspartate(D-aspartate) O-methyltransferase